MTRAELLQTAKPILFNTDMVRAILDGRKTVTRRCVKPKSKNAYGFFVLTNKSDGSFAGVYDYDDDENAFDKPQRQPAYKGDILYVREAFAPVIDYIDGEPETVFAYKASTPDNQYVGNVMSLPITAWHPSIHMPKEAARIFLRVTDVRVERVQDITEEQAKAEGANQCYEQIDSSENRPVTYLAEDGKGYYISGFKNVWDSTVKKSDLDRYGWAANPWVWCIEFERIEVQE